MHYEFKPLTRYQSLFWCGQKLYPDVPLFSDAAYEIVPQVVDIDHLRCAWAALVRHSDALRTIIVDHHGEPRQIVLPELPAELNAFDFSMLADPDTAMASWAQERCQALFDFERQLFDVALIKLSCERFALYLNVHHIITDAWSNALIVRQLREYYAMSVAGELNEPLPPLPAFADYVEYESKRILSRRSADAAAYWGTIASRPALTFYGREAKIKTTQAVRISRKIEGIWPHRVRTLQTSRRSLGRHLAPHSIFGTVVLCFLHGITNARSITVGSPFHNRNGWENVIGLLMQIVPITIDIEPHDDVAILCGRLANAHLRALRYRDWPIGNPLTHRYYDVEFNYIPSVVPSFAGIKGTRRVWLHSGHSTTPLSIQIYKNDDGFTVELDMHGEIFDDDLRWRTIADFEHVLHTVLTQPTSRILDISNHLSRGCRYSSRDSQRPD